MLIDVVTLFPRQIQDFLGYSIIKRAIDEKKVEVRFHDLRKWAVDERGSVDARPYGGGLGMILRVEPVISAIRALKMQNLNLKMQNDNAKLKMKDMILRFAQNDKSHIRENLLEIRENPGDQNFGKGNITGNQKEIKELVAIFDARGEKYSQKKAFEFAGLDHLILICGHYEGFDERILKFVDLSLSIGDFVLTGGEIPALVVVDSIVRLLPGVLKEGVVEDESFSVGVDLRVDPHADKPGGLSLRKKEKGMSGVKGKLKENLEEELEERVEVGVKEYPQYTRPEEWEGLKVPSVLLSGNHLEIEKWRKSR